MLLYLGSSLLNEEGQVCLELQNLSRVIRIDQLKCLLKVKRLDVGESILHLAILYQRQLTCSWLYHLRLGLLHRVLLLVASAIHHIQITRCKRARQAAARACIARNAFWLLEGIWSVLLDIVAAFIGGHELQAVVMTSCFRFIVRNM